MIIGEGTLVEIYFDADHFFSILVDLDTDEDWGNFDINEDGSVGYGNEEDGYKPVHSVELYVEGDKNTPLEMREFIKMYLVRNIAYSEGFKIADQKKLMESFGFSEGEYEIPSRWMECAPDYKG